MKNLRVIQKFPGFLVGMIHIDAQGAEYPCNGALSAADITGQSYPQHDDNALLIAAFCATVNLFWPFIKNRIRSDPDGIRFNVDPVSLYRADFS